MEWQLQMAKSRFSELVTQAQDGPQVVTVRGVKRAVMVSAQEYERLVQRANGGTLAEFLSQSPLAEAVQTGDLVLERDADTGREVSF